MDKCPISIISWMNICGSDYKSSAYVVREEDESNEGILPIICRTRSDVLKGKAEREAEEEED